MKKVKDDIIKKGNSIVFNKKSVDIETTEQKKSLKSDGGYVHQKRKMILMQVKNLNKKLEQKDK
jgi:hypothetical protein